MTAASRVMLLARQPTSGSQKSVRPHREADEAWDAGRYLKPLFHFSVILATAENDATDLSAPVASGSRNDRLTILATIESFDFPDIRFDAGILEISDRSRH
jgi:hypothetical protein